MAYELIETIEVGAGGAASIEFTGIPQDGVDLVLAVSVRATTAGRLDRDLYVTYNSLTANYSNRSLRGNGSSAISYSYATSRWTVLDGVPCADTTANTYNSIAITLPNYASAGSKSASFDLVNENNGTESIQDITAASNSTSGAITSIKLAPSADSFVQYSTASLYMITAD